VRVVDVCQDKGEVFLAQSENPPDFRFAFDTRESLSFLHALVSTFREMCLRRGRESSPDIV
jgi:hypothetical protein